MKLEEEITVKCLIEEDDYRNTNKNDDSDDSDDSNKKMNVIGKK